MPIIIHSGEDIEGMRVAGRLAAQVLDFIAPHVRPGISTEELDRLCHDYMVNVQGTIPAPLNYTIPNHPPYPKSICTSINNVVCHGIPDKTVLRDGDIINIDVTVIKDGYHGDTGRMFLVGQVQDAAKRLCEAAFRAMWAGIRAVRPGATFGDIGFAVDRSVEMHGYQGVREFCGHGIGKQFHAEPNVFHYGMPGSGARLEPGMIFTIEPLVNAGRRETFRSADGWTVCTRDGSWSAQWEHTVLVTETGYEVLTVSAGVRMDPARAVMQYMEVATL